MSEVLWMRLARLGRSCDVKIEAVMACPEGGAMVPERHWHVLIRNPAHSPLPIEVYRLSALEAIEDALARAEALGWPVGGEPGDAGPTLPPVSLQGDDLAAAPPA